MEVERSNSCKLEAKGFCTDHSNYKELRCMDCEVWICGICSSLNHKNCQTLLVNEAHQAMKEQVSQKIENELESRSWVSDCLDSSLKTCDERNIKLLEERRRNKSDLTDCKTKIQELNSFKSEDCKFLENLKQLQISAKNSENEKELLKTQIDLKDLLGQRKTFMSQLEDLKLHKSFPATLDDLKTLCEKESVYLVDHENQRALSYGLVTVKEDRVWISSFKRERPIGRSLSLNEFLFRFSGSFDLPKRVFLKLISGTSEVDLVIEADGQSTASEKFVLICSGLDNFTFRGRTLRYQDSAYYELYPSSVLILPGAVKVSQGSWKEGTVFGVADNHDIKFSIELEDFSGFSYPKLGVIVSGLKELKGFRGTYFAIEDSGLVI